MKQRHIDMNGPIGGQIVKVVTAVSALMRNAVIRNITVSAAILFAALFVFIGVANADVSLTPISALKSPIPNPVSVVLNCDEHWNPSCTVTATTTSGASLRSYFYIDGRYRGPANRTYTNVCALFWLRDGVHTARVYAIDAKWNSASVGPYRVISCDRLPPSIFVYLWYGRNWKVNIVPVATDYGSGIASKTFSVDGVNRTWQTYTDACAQLTLATGWHKTNVTATDNAGHGMTGGIRTFYCP